MNEWGVPDWQDASAYTERPDWHRGRWRWEFIRRRDDIRELFDRLAPQAYQDDLLSFAERPEGFPEGRVKTPDERGFYLHARALFDGQPIVQPLPNPRIGDQPHFAIAWNDNPNSLYRGIPLRADRKDYFQVAFDLSRPLGPQLDMAKRWAQEIQAERKGKNFQVRQHQDKWPLYLRVLDSRAAGASWSQVTEMLPMTHSKATIGTARSIYKQAEDLCFKSWI